MPSKLDGEDEANTEDGVARTVLLGDNAGLEVAEVVLDLLGSATTKRRELVRSSQPTSALTAASRVIGKGNAASVSPREDR